MEIQQRMVWDQPQEAPVERHVFTMVDQVARDMATLRQQPVPFPGRAFFEERIAAYREEILRTPKDPSDGT